MFRSIIGYIFMAGLLGAQDAPYVPAQYPPTGGPESLVRGETPNQRKAREDKERERQAKADYNEGLAKRFVALNDALREFQKAYVGTKGEVWPHKEVEQVKKAWRSLKKFDSRFDEEKNP